MNIFNEKIWFTVLKKFLSVEPNKKKFNTLL